MKIKIIIIILLISITLYPKDSNRFYIQKQIDTISRSPKIEIFPINRSKNESIVKRNKTDYKKELLETGLLKKNNRNKYLNYKEKLVTYNWPPKWFLKKNNFYLKDFKITFFTTAIAIKSNNQLLIYLEKIKSQSKINSKSFLYMIKIKILKYLIKINDIFFIKLIANNYCNCSILNSDIKKEKYSSGIIYNIHKDFMTKKKSFNIQNDFTMNIFETGSVIDFSWNRLGEKIDSLNNKKK